MSLPIIGALLGHTQAQTTARYAHLYDDPLRTATERVGAIVASPKAPAVVPLENRRLDEADDAARIATTASTDV